MRTWKLLFVAFAMAAFGILESASSQPSPSEWMNQTAAQIEDRIETKHPIAFFVLAAKKFEEGKRDEAVFWLYAGQVRYRVYMLENPNLDHSLFASLMQQVGRPINEYAFGDIPQLVKIIDGVLDWDAKNPDPLTAKSTRREDVRQNLLALRAQVLSERDFFREQRKKKGLENRN